LRFCPGSRRGIVFTHKKVKYGFKQNQSSGDGYEMDFSEITTMMPPKAVFAFGGDSFGVTRAKLGGIIGQNDITERG
jgi:hypothetical protein